MSDIGTFLVSWKGVQKGKKDEPLPMRPFDTKIEAEAYIIGCADIISIHSQNNLLVKDIVKDFTINVGEN
tara:strand:+ start:269 stop:478 length:210 start_codon:yes stop_codon:yes gene_type:complete